MKTLNKAFIIGATVFSLGSLAFNVQAQEAQHREYAHTKFDAAKMAEHMDKRAQKLHDALKLTAAQEPAWQTYRAAIKSDMAAGHGGDHAAMKDLSAPERMEKMIEMAKSHTARMENHLAALKTFYAVLTPEQQKIFDQAAMRMHHGGHHMMMMHRQG